MAGPAMRAGRGERRLRAVVAVPGREAVDELGIEAARMEEAANGGVIAGAEGDLVAARWRKIAPGGLEHQPRVGLPGKEIGGHERFRGRVGVAGLGEEAWQREL